MPSSGMKLNAAPLPTITAYWASDGAAPRPRGREGTREARGSPPAEREGDADRQGEDERQTRDEHHRGAAEREEPRAVAVAPGTDRETGHERGGRLDPDDRARDLGTQTELPNDEEADGDVHEHQARHFRERGEPDQDESECEDAVAALRDGR